MKKILAYICASFATIILLPYAYFKKADQFIGGEEDPYMIRWFLWKPDLVRPRLYLHNFKKSDDDRALHDHPWHSWSLCLGGKATELVHGPKGVEDVPVVSREIKFGSWVYREPEFTHRMVIPEGGHCWTLFITGPSIREWGFHCPKGWRHWKDFTGYNQTGDSDRIGRGCGED